MVKTCSKCRETKKITEFYKSKSNQDGYQFWCKVCYKKAPSSVNRTWYSKNKEYAKKRAYKWYRENKDYFAKYCVKLRESKKGLHHVYLLPEEHYVGCTEYFKVRMNCHKTQHNRNIDNARILASFKNRKEALELEEFLHELGYQGGSNVYK